MDLEFKFKLLPTIATLLILPILVGLGFWQLDRAQQKTEIRNLLLTRSVEPEVTIGATIESTSELEFRRVRVSGTWDQEREFLLDNQVLNSRVGFNVITPLIFSGNKSAVLVNRGWVPASPDRTQLPDTYVNNSETTISGMVTIPDSNPFVLEDPPPLDPDRWQRIWQTIDLTRFSEAVPYKIQGFVIELDPNSESGFERKPWEFEDDWIYRHKAYAFQWFALSTALVVIYFLVTVRPSRRTTN